MAIARYLAMTADEFSLATSISEKVAWMACHFSPYSTSLSNLPDKLPANSLLILNDSTPPSGQDPKEVRKTLENTLKNCNCFALLLDFQRHNNPECCKMVQELTQLDYPVCVSESYAKDFDCPIFLPPLPLIVPLEEYIKPWQDRLIWLDTALSCQQIIVTEKDSAFHSIKTFPDCLLVDKKLHCHYHVEIKKDSIVFTLQRTKEDLDELLIEAEALGIVAAVGLYQELK